MSRLRGYLGMSLDARIAGPEDQLDWLTADRPRQATDPLPSGTTPWLTYEDFTADIGVMLMGRRTLDVVAGFDAWPYGDLPVLVATTRPLSSPTPTVTAVRGTPAELADLARSAAGGKDVYVDGGMLVCAMLEADLLDELVTTILPTVRGAGVGLFDGLTQPRDIDLVGTAVDHAGMVQLTWRPQRPTDDAG